MSLQTNVVFLHIPKTAGQSVHEFMVRLFGADAVSPARVNEQLATMTVAEIRRYRVTSGHMDWAAIDCIEPPRFVFTILREPVDRILSFYLFLRRDASLLSADELDRPHRSALRAALRLSVDDYFCRDIPGLRGFIDNRFENAYCYFFAGRTDNSRRRYLDIQQADPSFTDQRVLDIALANLALLDGVYLVDDLRRLQIDLCRIAGHRDMTDPGAIARINSGEEGSTVERLEKLRALGATQATFDRIEAMTRLDRIIWDRMRERLAAKPNAQADEVEFNLGMGRVQRHA